MSTPARRAIRHRQLRCDALSIDKNQGFFGQQTTQVWYDAAIPAIGDVLVDGRAHLLWQLREQVGCVVSAQFLNIFRAISIHGVRASSSAVGIFEPVTMTRSTSAVAPAGWEPVKRRLEPDLARKHSLQ